MRWNKTPTIGISLSRSEVNDLKVLSIDTNRV